MMARLVKRPPPSATSQPEPESASKPKFIAKPRSPPLGFLSLPPELRNVIYDYVLTSPSGQLHYRPLQLNVKPEGGSEYYLTSSANDSGSRSNFQFFLRGIFITPVMEEFNQLQHVSKQVRAETAGLSLDPRNNTIHFDYCPDTTHSANAHLTTFLSMLESTGFARPISIVINDFDPRMTLKEQDHFRDDRDAITELARLCTRLPNVNVQYILSDWSYVDRWTGLLFMGRVMFLWRGAYYAHALRGQTAFPHGASFFGMTQKGAIIRAKKWLRGSDAGFIPGNIKFVPKAGVDGSKDAWREFQPASGFNVRGLSEDMAVDLVNDWIENGI